MREKDEEEEGQRSIRRRNDSNKLLIDDFSGDKALSFWSKIAVGRS
jgi:hypothetical protein